jgi:hypothetical protein
MHAVAVHTGRWPGQVRMLLAYVSAYYWRCMMEFLNVHNLSCVSWLIIWGWKDANETRYLLIEMAPPSTEIWESDTSIVFFLLWLRLCKFEKLHFVSIVNNRWKKTRVGNKQIKRDSFHSSCVFGQIVLSHYSITRGLLVVGSHMLYRIMCWVAASRCVVLRCVVCQISSWYNCIHRQAKS